MSTPRYTAAIVLALLTIAPAARPGPRTAGPTGAFLERSPENHSSARRAYRPAMRVNAISVWQRAMARAAINAQPRRIVDPRGEMSIGRRSIAIGTR